MKLVWEKIETEFQGAIPDNIARDLGQLVFSRDFYRTKVPGGWLVYTEISLSKAGCSLSFIPDREWRWDELLETHLPRPGKVTYVSGGDD